MKSGSSGSRSSVWFSVRKRLNVVLFGIAGLCWIPAAALQYKMKALAEQAPGKERLPAIYWKHERIWSILGIAAFPAVIAIFTLMIFKPV